MTFRVLTVGDGDLSFSLALKRAYPQINVVASTLVESSAELVRTYASAVDTLNEFQEAWKGKIIYGTDATKLKEKIKVNGEKDKFDMVLFNHPHLGDGTLLESEQRHAERHYALLAHYFFSAKNLLKTDGRVHVCLCGNQPKTWRVMAAADNNGLQCVCEESTACPIDRWMFKEGESYKLADIQPHYPTKRKFRNGSLGSKHFLARYGYRHQRTEGDLFDGSVKHINVEQSINFVFANKGTKEQTQTNSEENTCTICHLKFDKREQLIDHLDAPGLPDVVTGANKVRVSGNAKMNQNQTNLTCSDKKKMDSSPSPELISIEEANVLVEATVASEFDSKRIKWLCRQDKFALSKFIKSKSQCEEAIKRGRVFVNREIALDSGRIVRVGDVVSLIEIPQSSITTNIAHDGSDDPGVRVVKELQLQHKEITLQVAYKPVSIRCVGSFSPNTLEMIIKKKSEYSCGMKNMFCHSISKLDTGCAGLCVLAVSSSKIADGDLASLQILYTFDVLVHGTPPENWRTTGVYAQIPVEGLRQWKRQKTAHEENNADISSDTPSSVVASETILDLDGALFIKCHDSLQIDEQHISTLTVQSRFDNGRLANVISYVLRKLGYPVVNDRFGKREYSALPRRMKNIVKQKVCIGCYRVDIEYEGVASTVSIDSHKRTQSSFWREILQDAVLRSAS